MARWLVRERGDGGAYLSHHPMVTRRPAEALDWATREEAQGYIDTVLRPRFEPVEIDDAGSVVESDAVLNTL